MLVGGPHNIGAGGVDGGEPDVYTDPSTWTCVQEWDTRIGDLTAIDGQPGTKRNSSFAWSPDGTRFTLCNTTTDNVQMYTASTPFDPDTLTHSSSIGVTNPRSMRYSSSGSIFYCNHIVGDEIVRYPANNFFMTSATKHSELTKANVSYTGSSDGGFTISNDLSYLLFHGEVSNQNALKKVSLASGDLDNFSVLQTVELHLLDNDPPSSIGTVNWSGISNNEQSVFITNGAVGVQVATMSTPADISTISFGVFTTTGTMGCTRLTNVSSIWVDPDNPRYVWLGGDLSGVQLAKIDTGA